MVAAGVTAPLIARHVRLGFVVAGALGLSVAGYVMLAWLDDSASGTAIVVAGFSLAYLGLGTIAALGTDLVVGSAPAEKAGSASAMSETVQDLGVSLGIAILGSLATAIYRQTMHDHIPAGLGPDVRGAVSDSLWGAPRSLRNCLPGFWKPRGRHSPRGSAARRCSAPRVSPFSPFWPPFHCGALVPSRAADSTNSMRRSPADG